MAFKLGRENRNNKNPENVKIGRGLVGDTPINMKSFNDGTVAEANMDGSIDIDPSIDLNSPYGRRVLKHEMKHVDQMKSGKAGYNDTSVTWNGNKYPRKGGKILYRGSWYKEGDRNLPWEAEAIKAESSVFTKKSPMKNYKKGYYKK